MDTKLIVSASPHVRSEETTQSLMANVIVALCPCVVASAINFWYACTAGNSRVRGGLRGFLSGCTASCSRSPTPSATCPPSSPASFWL